MFQIAEYTAKKYKLILAKKDLEEQITAFGRKSNNRFELAIAFLKEAIFGDGFWIAQTTY